MALKDLKSDLSKFRMPKQDALENKKVEEVNKKSNQTPLSSMVDSAPKIPRSQTTTNKEGVEPRKFDNSPNFLGETTPNKVDNSEQFLGETTPKPANNQSRFLGETTPTKADNQSQFLGETTPKPMSLEERYLGQTSPTPSEPTSQFLGETTPKPANNQSRFLGETTPTKADNQSQFLGETTPIPANNESRFLGETTPTPANNQSRFLGETTPTPANNQSRFLGETTPTSTNNTGQFLGETTKNKITQGDKEKGETTPTPANNQSRFLGETTPKDVNYFQDIHATGFNSKFGGADSTKFVGINPDNTIFDSKNSLFSNIDNNTFTLKNTYEDTLKSSGGIGEAHTKRNSPSFLDLQYNKFNLKDDSFNTGLGLFRHPLILRGIQRSGISNGEPQSWGTNSIDGGFIRGGAITSTTRALVDVARVGGWLASVEGLLWSTKQVGLQKTNRFAKIWTPANMLASIAGQHIGFKPDRSGIIGLDVTGKYSEPIIGGYKDKIKTIYNKDLFGPLGTITGMPFLTQTDDRGGFDSIYGIGTTLTSRFENTFSNPGKDFAHPKAGFTQKYEPLSDNPSEFKTYSDDLPTDDEDGKNFGLAIRPTTTTRYENTFNNPSQRFGNERAEYTQKYEPLSDNPSEFKTYSDDLPTDDEEAKNFGLAIQPNETGGGISSKTDGNPITNYETIAYGNIPKRGANDPIIDFRSLLDGDEKERAKNSDYTNKSLEKKGTTGLSFPDYGKLTSANRIDYTKGTNEYDRVNASDIGGEEMNDLVKLLFQVHNDTSSRIQFRGTVSGITETFSPSWESFKYSGRADQAYKYTTFERSISFNFKVYPTSKAELIPMYRKLQQLSSMTMPQYSGANGYQGILVDFTLGNLWKKQLSFIESLSYTFSDETPWDIDEGASMGIDVQIGLKLLGNRLPQYRSKVYDLNGL